MQINVIGIAWYKREHYLQLKSMFEDGDKLHSTYDEWLLAAENGRKDLQIRGYKTVRIDINPDNFTKFCSANGVKFNVEGRQAFVNSKLASVI